MNLTSHPTHQQVNEQSSQNRLLPTHAHRCIVDSSRFGSSVQLTRCAVMIHNHIQDFQGGILKDFSPSEETEK